MAGQDSNDRIAEFLKQACLPAAASPEFKAKLRQHLNDQAGALGTESPKPLWQQQFLWIPAAAASAVAVALLIYFVAFHSAPLTVTTSVATGIQTTTATLNGNLDSLGAADNVQVSFEWGASKDYGKETAPEVRAAAGSVQADLSGLAPNTTYHFRLKVVGRHGTVYGPDREFTTGPAPPVVTTGDAAKVRTDSATLRGRLDDLGSTASVSVSFEWGLTESYGNETTLESKTATGKYSADLDGLSPNTTYHFRAKAVGDETAYGADAQFTTSATPPSAATNDATNVATTSATLNGELTSLGTASSISVSFEWGTTTGGPYPNPTDNQTSTATGDFSANLTGLTPETTYYYRAKAVGDGEDYGIERSFTTNSISPPAVTTNDASNLATTSAVLNGNLDDLGTASSVIVSFEWGTTAGGPYTSLTDNQTMTSTGDFSANLTGLTLGTTYYYRAKAVGDDTAYGADAQFTTSATPPSAATNDATNISTNSARLNGELTSKGTATTVTVSFEWGTTSGEPYAETTLGQTKDSVGAFDWFIDGLTPSTTYYFRAKAVGDDVVYGADMVFTTGNAPPPQRTWYLSKDISGSVKVMYDGDTSKPIGTVPLHSDGSSSASKVWRADQSLAGKTCPGDNWTVHLALSHLTKGHEVIVEIGTLDGSAFSSHGSHIFIASGTNNQDVYEFEFSIWVNSFTVPSNGYVATRITVTNGYRLWVDVHVGGSQSYVTSPAYPEPTAPAVTTNAATGVEPTTATLNGSLDGLGTAGSVMVYFEWGMTTDYGNPIDVGPQTSGGIFSAPLTGLTPNTTYHFRAKAVGDGTNYSVDMIFTTPP